MVTEIFEDEINETTTIFLDHEDEFHIMFVKYPDRDRIALTDVLNECFEYFVHDSSERNVEDFIESYSESGFSIPVEKILEVFAEIHPNYANTIH